MDYIAEVFDYIMTKKGGGARMDILLFVFAVMAIIAGILAILDQGMMWLKGKFNQWCRAMGQRKL